MKSAQQEPDLSGEEERTDSALIETQNDLAREAASEPAPEAPAEDSSQAPEQAPAPLAVETATETARPLPIAPRRKKNQADGAAKTAFGLIVIWACMTLVFYAHRQSDIYIHFDAAVPGSPPPPDLHTKPGSLISLFQRDTTTKQMLATLAGSLDLTIDAAELDKLGDAGDTVKSIRLDKTPIYRALHTVMDDPRFGIGLRGTELIIFEQQLDAGTGGNNVQEMKWQSELELSNVALMIFPSAESNLWFKVRLAGPAAADPSKQQALELEVWRGDEWLSMARVELDATGTAQLTMSNVENSQFIVRRVEQIPGTAPHYHLQFLKQSFAQATPKS